MTSHAAAILARHGNCVVTRPGAVHHRDRRCSGDERARERPGERVRQPGGSAASVTTAVKMTTLKADAALAMFEVMWAAARTTGGTERAGLLRTCTVRDRSVYDNYAKTLRTLNGSEQSYVNLANGQHRPSAFNGIAILNRADWDTRINRDFGGVRPHAPCSPRPATRVRYRWRGKTDEDRGALRRRRTEQHRAQRIQGRHPVHLDQVDRLPPTTTNRNTT